VLSLRAAGWTWLLRPCDSWLKFSSFAWKKLLLIGGFRHLSCILQPYGMMISYDIQWRRYLWLKPPINWWNGDPQISLNTLEACCGMLPFRILRSHAKTSSGLRAFCIASRTLVDRLRNLHLERPTHFFEQSRGVLCHACFNIILRDLVHRPRPSGAPFTMFHLWRLGV
jgi:hypothetical protein